MTDMSKEMPWVKNYEGYLPKLSYPDRTMYECLAFAARLYPRHHACEYIGQKIRYSALIEKVDRLAACLDRLGVREGDKVAIALPNTPQAVYAVYATNRLGAVATMIHPLSAKKEVEHYLSVTGAKVAITLDIFFESFPYPGEGNSVEHLIVTSAKDEMGTVRSFGYQILQGRKDYKPKYDDKVVRWTDVMDMASPSDAPEPRGGQDSIAMILFSGGTTGKSKGVLLSNRNVNAASIETGVASRCLKDGLVMAAVMPMFHGFGFCVGIHLMLINGYLSILVPRFTPDSYAKMVAKKRPNLIAGVPTLYEHMIRSKHLRKADLSDLHGIFCGGDSLTDDLKTRFDDFLKDHKCTATIREGYGATECVTACCLTPKNPKLQRRGSIGLPFPDTNYMIAKVGTDECTDYMEEGEICISGPGIMRGYLDEPEETANALHTHADGTMWLHTGDMGYMDADGYLYFRQRIKRMIVSSGYNIYPGQIEDTVCAHPSVKAACAVGVPDDIRGQVIRLYIVTEPGVARDDATMAEIKTLCKYSFSKFACPRQYQFIDKLPETKVGKIAYYELEQMAKSVIVPTEALPGDGPAFPVEEVLDPMPTIKSPVESIIEPTITAMKMPLEQLQKKEKEKR